MAADPLAPFRADPSGSAVLLDVDGVLAPIAARPELSVVPDATLALLGGLLERYRLVACVSGRTLAEVRRLVPLPGLLAASMYICTVVLIGMVNPKFLPRAPRHSWTERVSSVRDVWATMLLFVFVIGGLYGGLFTPTEAGGMGAGGAFLIGVLRGRLDRTEIRRSLLQATRTAAAVFTVLIGALLFGYFLTVTQTPQKVTEFLTGLGIGRYGVLALIMLMYLVLGCLMDSLAMVILTVPIIFPVMMHLGFDPIWFGIIIVMTVELGLIHPLVGMIVFVIKSVVQEVSFSTIFKGVLPFIVTDLIRLVILIAFPIIALWLPSRM